MSICQPMISVSLPPLLLADDYAIQPRILNLSVNLIGLTMLGFVIVRLIDGYHKALQGIYQEYTPELAAVIRANQSAGQSTNQMSPQPHQKLHFPLVFPLYFKYICAVFLLFFCQSVMQIFQPNNPFKQPIVFYISIILFATFHAFEHGLMVFLCQRSIGENAIKRSIMIGCFWGAIVLTGCVVGAGIDVSHTQSANQSNSSSHFPVENTTQQDFALYHYQPPAFTQSINQLLGDTWMNSAFRDDQMSKHANNESLSSDLDGRTDWRVDHWFDLSGSSLIIDSESINLFWILISCLAADGLMILMYSFLFLLRLKCCINLSNNQKFNQLFMPWLRSRISAFYLARFFLSRRLLSFISMSLYFINLSITQSKNKSINESIDCLNVFIQLFQIGYGACLYLFLVWDSRFWRRLEYLTNGPFPHYRSLDDSSTNQSITQNVSDPSVGDETNSRSIAPLLKLPKSGLTNLDSLIDCLIDFSELNIDTSSPLGLSQLHPSVYQSNNQSFKQSSAVYAATYRNESVAVKRIKCDTLSINQIEDQLNEARFLKSINHENIVRLIGICIRPPSICLVSELCENGTLFEWIKHQAIDQTMKQNNQSISQSSIQSSYQSNNQPLSVSNYQSPLTGTEHARYHAFDQPSLNQSSSQSSNRHVLNQSTNQMYSYCLDAVSAVAYLHNLSICHRDIKSTNFVINQFDRCKLIDFGESFKQSIGKSRKSTNSSLFPSTNQSIKRGTLGWMAPELLVDCAIPSHLTDCLGKSRIREIQLAINHELKQSVNQSINQSADQSISPLTQLELQKILASVGIHDGGDVELINQSTKHSINQADEDEWNDMLEMTYIRVQSIVGEQPINQSISQSDQPVSVPQHPGTPLSNRSVNLNQSRIVPSQSIRSLSSISSLSFQSLTRTFFPRSTNQSSTPPINQSTINQSINQLVSEKVDIYGLGMLIYSINQSKLYPFSRIPSFLLPFLISAGVRPSINQSINQSINLPPLLIRLIRSSWSTCPYDRPSANQLIDRLECIRFQLTGELSERLKTSARCGNQSINQSINQTNNQTINQSPQSEPRPSTPSSVQVREGLYGQFYQRPRSRASSSQSNKQSTNQSIPQSIPQSINQSTNSFTNLSAFSLPPRLPSVPNHLNHARFSFNQSPTQSTSQLSYSPSSHNQSINQLIGGHISAPSTPPSFGSSIGRARSVSPERYNQSISQPIYRSTHQSSSQLISQLQGHTDSGMGRIDSGSETDEESLETID